MSKIGEKVMVKRLLLSVAALVMTAAPAFAQTSTLENNVPVNVAESWWDEALFKIDVPAGATNLVISVAGGNGDADLYVKHGEDPGWFDYDCRPYLEGNDETCYFANPETGFYYISVYASETFSGATLTGSYSVTPPPPTVTVSNTAAAGDSITRAFAADCSGNVLLWELACLLGGDQPEHSWFDGSSDLVFSVHDRYKSLDSSITAHNGATTGAEMFNGGDNGSEPNFAEQAAAIVARSPVPDHVEVVLGGNDICSRNCTDASVCDDPLYSESEWRGAVQAGLDTLMTGLPQGGTVYLGSVAKVQNLRDAGIGKQQNDSGVNCKSLWSTFDVCQIVTKGGKYNGEGKNKRHNAVAAAQQLYNEVLRDEAAAYNSNANGKNPNGIEVVAEYVDQNNDGMANFDFTKNNINGGDCFHPNVATQTTIADFMWASNPDQ